MGEGEKRMEQGDTVFQRFAVFMETETRAVEVVTYGVAGVGLLVALYKVRPFSKFRRPTDVPSHFVQKRVPLYGKVVRVEPSSGGLLMVDHKPLLSLPFLNKKEQLPVRLAGVDVIGNGISWLQSIVAGKQVEFVPLAKSQKYLDCIVTIPQANKENLKVAEELVKVGFGTVHPLHSELLKDKSLSAYQKSLIRAQKWAEHRRNGHWHFAKHPTLMWRIEMFLNEKLKSILPRIVTERLSL